MLDKLATGVLKIRMEDMLLPIALSYFEAVVEAGSVQAAARNLMIAPSALSRQIGLLENDLGVQLFSRHRTGMLVTGAGAQLHEYAARARAEERLLRDGLEAGTDGLSGTVAIATVEGMVPALLPRWVVQARNKYPGIQFAVTQLGSMEVVAAVLNGEADLGFTFGRSTRVGLRTHEVIHSPIQLFVSPQHELWDQRSCEISDLGECLFILPDHTFGLRNEVEFAFAEAATTLRINTETSSLRMCLAVVEDSDLSTFSTPVMATDFLESKRLRAIDIGAARFQYSQISLVSRTSDRKPLTNELERFFSARMAQLGGKM